MSEYLKEVEEVVDDEYFGESYDKELAWKEECYNDGIKEGSLNKSIEIAKSLLESGVNLDIIIKSTGLSKETIEKLNILEKK